MKNKIMPSGVFALFFILFLTLKSQYIFSQTLPESVYGLGVVNSIRLYQQTLLKHPEKKMSPLYRKPGLILDLRYATKNNFTKGVLYAELPMETYLRKPVLLAFNKVLHDLNKRGLGLRIFDAYRPYFVTVTLWEKVHDSRYAADPASGSGHNRGVALDLTLVDLKTKKNLAMPTDFDDFTDSAHQDFMALDSTILKNRQLLREVMEKYGFIALSTEWWHFSWPHPEHFEVLDLGFNQLKEAESKN